MAIVFITGSTRGFGFYMAASFCADGHEVILNGRKDNKSIVDTLPKAKYHRSDVYKVSSYHFSMYEPDIIINNAFDNEEPLRSGFGQIFILDEAIKYFRIKGGGVIININSVAGINPNPKEATYCAAKFALRGYSESIKYELRKEGIRIIDIYPGAINTGMSSEREDHDKLIDPSELARFIAKIYETKSFIVSSININKS